MNRENRFFKIKGFSGRIASNDCSQVVFCMAASAPSENWEDTDDEPDYSTMVVLYHRDGSEYVGWL